MQYGAPPPYAPPGAYPPPQQQYYQPQPLPGSDMGMPGSLVEFLFWWKQSCIYTVCLILVTIIALERAAALVIGN